MAKPKRKSRLFLHNSRPRGPDLKKIWFALLFLAGGFSHEVRNPTSCHCIAARQLAAPPKRARA
jgi:hypothetical protein